MIRYALACGKGHAFESWFPSAAGYEGQKARGLVQCPVCGSLEVEKALMAPALGKAAAGAAAGPKLKAPEGAEAAKIAALRAEIEAKADYVGLRFADEARRMHAGDIETRAIYGEAKLQEARALLEEGVPIAPLPFRPRARQN